MTQLILGSDENTLTMPEARKGNYICENVMLGTDIEMASGRVVREYRGRYYRLTYQYTYLRTATKEILIPLCEAGQEEPMQATFLDPTDNELKSGIFLVTEFKAPEFIWGRSDTDAIWGNYKIVLREVDPHD